MTNQEAIEEIKSRISTTEYVGGSYVDCVDLEALKLAISVLQAQEVKQEVKNSGCTYRPDCPWYDGSKCNSPNDHGYHECDYDRGIFPESYEENVKNSTESSLTLTQKGLDTISRQAALETVRTMHKRCDTGSVEDYRDLLVTCFKNLPSAQPERLTDDDFETIRIHLSAYKERLCNQHRWEEAEEYQRIIDRFMRFASSQPEIVRCKDCEYGKQDEVGRWFCRGLGCQIGNEDGSGYCADAERRINGSD